MLLTRIAGLSAALLALSALGHGVGLAEPQPQQPLRASSVSLDPQWPADTTGKGCASPTWRGETGPKDPRRVLVIGDSLTRESRLTLERALAAKGWNPTVRCWGGKGTQWGVEQIKRARALKQLPNTVVIALGTNDVWWLGTSLATGVTAIRNALGPNRQIYWVNLRFGPNNYSDLPHHREGNRIIRVKGREYRNMTVINFAKQYGAALKRTSSVGWADGVHLNYQGYVVRSTIIAEALGKPRLK